MNWPRGTVLGGTSVINYMIYTRGHPRDFDKWAAAGNPGWSYKDVLPYYMKSEMANNLTHIEYDYHGHGGPQSVSDSFQSPLTRSFIEAGKQLGFPEVDYTSRNTYGFSSVKTTTLKGKRHDVASAFILPYLVRKNLYVMTDSFVVKILINEKTKTAYGVKYIYNGEIITALAKKEVIISGGAFFSPQLLMLSGIGPSEHLTELGIPVLQDLPVGKNLHDHLTYIGLPLIANDSAPVELSDLLNPFNIFNFLHYGTGPYASIGGVEGLAYIKTPISEEPGKYPDIEYIFAGTYITLDLGTMIRKSWGISDYHYNKYMRVLHGKPVFTIMPMLLHPKSIGWMKLRSSNPFERPKFYGNYFTDPERKDLKTMIESIRFILKLITLPAFQKHGVKVHDMPVPGCESKVDDFEQYWECALRTFSVTLHHQVGTCKMGPKSDTTAVVDPRLRVYGINKLRVADTSVIPFALAAHTNAPSIMVGEKAADIIKHDWGVLKNKS